MHSAEVIYVLGLVFAAGGFFSRSATLRKDVNGVGARVKKIVEESSDHHRRLCMALLVLANEEQKKTVVQLLGEQK